MMRDWQSTLDQMQISGPKEEEAADFADNSEYGALTGDDEGTMMLASGFGNLYKYELSYKNNLKATKYAIPVVGKKGDYKVWRGPTPETVISQYNSGVAKGGDAESTFQDIKQADKYLKEAHGMLNSEIWHVTKLTDLGPVSKSAPPAQVTSPTITKAAPSDIVSSAQQAVERGQTEQQIMAAEKAFSITEFVKTGKNAVYIIAGVGAVVVIGGIIFFFARQSPAGQAGQAAGGLLRGMKRRK